MLNIENASREEMEALVKQIEDEMNAAAELLEFEIAARLRDELKELKKEMKEIDIDG